MMLSGSFENKRIWFDATGLVSWGMQNVTGIQRVELSLCSYAKKHSEYGIAYMDFLGRFRPASKRLLAYLNYIELQEGLRTNQTYFEKLRSEFAYFDVQMSSADNLTARRLAKVLCGENRSLYKITKLLIRILVWFVFAIRGFSSAIRHFIWIVFSKKKPPNPNCPVLLISHALNRKPYLQSSLAAAGYLGAHIFYDITPVLRPELVPRKLTKKMDAFYRRVLTLPELIVIISETVRNDLKNWNDKNLKATYPFPFHVCKLNSTFDVDSKTVAVPSLSKKRFAMYCSTMNVGKRHDLLASVWANLAKSIPLQDLPDLVLIGRPGSGSAALSNIIDANPQLAEKIHILSTLNDAQLRWCYKNAHFALFPSLVEGWGLGVSEALAYGVPVMHSDIPILHEAAQDLMPSAEAGNLSAWTDLVCHHLVNPELLVALRQRITSEYVQGTPDSFARCVFAYLKTQSFAASKNAAAP
jgi:glycosyltransferase involved in cell wall biosynthesis